MRYLFCMILILSNIEVQGSTYSIQTFLDYLQGTGYYEIIQAIKNAFGDDIAIDVCKELTKSNDCEEVVRIYMVFKPDIIDQDDNGGGNNETQYLPPIYIVNVSEIIRYFEENCLIKTEVKRKLIKFLLRYYFILIKEMKVDQELIRFIQRAVNIKCLINGKKYSEEIIGEPSEFIPK